MDDPVPEEKPVTRGEKIRLAIFGLGVASIIIAVLWNVE